MGKAVSAAAANSDFSKLLRGVRAGDSYVITSHGRPVAKIVPFATQDVVMSAARSTLFKRLRSQRATTVGRWTRDELYENA